jgi:cytoskeleton-associated protein 5
VGDLQCLWKISKSVKDNLEDGSLDAKKLLLDIDQFLQAIPPAEWRRRASDNIPLGDMPLRTVKTILQQVVGTFGDSVYDQLSLLERPENSFVYQYLYRLLNNSRSVVAPEASGSSEQLSRQSSTMSHSGPARARAGTNGSAGPVGNTPSHNGGIAGGAPMSPGRSSDIEMNLALKDIFDKIGNAQESKKGIAELYEFRKLHPE